MAEFDPKAIKAAFFDVDGTLIPFRRVNGERSMPASTQAAVRALQATGIPVILCTGRFIEMARDCEAYVPIDGYVTLNGQWCTLGDEVVRAVELDPVEAKRLFQHYLDGEVAGFIMYDDEAVFTGTPERLAEIDEPWRMKWYKPLSPDMADRPIYQFVVQAPTSGPVDVLSDCPHLTATRWDPESEDIISVGSGKVVGMRALCERLGITFDEIIAFGDGDNDLEMLGAAGFGVAMGNATGEVKAVADYVTTSDEEDGVWNALCHLGLIDGEPLD